MAEQDERRAQTTEDAPGGLFAAVKGVLATLIATGATRLELLSTDLDAERERLTSIFLFGLCAVLLFVIGLVFCALFVVLLYWDTHRTAAAALVLLALFGGGGAAAAITVYKVRHKPRLFAASLAELRRDVSELRT